MVGEGGALLTQQRVHAVGHQRRVPGLRGLLEERGPGLRRERLVTSESTEGAGPSVTRAPPETLK